LRRSGLGRKYQERGGSEAANHARTLSLKGRRRNIPA
jgi:hypothetical protein